MRIYIDGIEQDNAELHITTDAAATPAPVPEVPPIPEPEPGEPPVVAPEPTEPSPEPEPTIPVTPTGNLLVDQAATMQPGEWRNLADLTTWPGKDEGRTFKQNQYLENADGMGWTQPLGYHEGSLMLLLCRSDGNPEELMLMDRAGEFTLIEYPDGYLSEWAASQEPPASIPSRNGGRRPFHRLFVANGYLCFAPKLWSNEVGKIMRTPLDNPGVWELVGPSFNDGDVTANGAFAVIWSKAWQRIYAYTAGSKIWSRAWDDDKWTRHPDLPMDKDGNQLTGYAGFLTDNPIQEEILISGGQVFGPHPQTSDMAYKLTEPLGAPQLLANRKLPDGTPFYLKHGATKIIVHPDDGSYLLFTQHEYEPQRWYRSVTGGGTMHLFDDFDAIEPWGNYEPYAAIAQVPDTDVFAYISHIDGLGMYRPKSVEGLPSGPETDPINLPDNHEPPAPVDATFEEFCDSVPVGGAVEYLSDLPDEFANHQQFWTHNGHSANQEGYGPAGFFDPLRQKVIYIRDRTPNGSTRNYINVLLWDVGSGKASRGDIGAFQSDPLLGSPHTYDMQAYDASRGHAYYESKGDICRYVMDEDRYEVIPTTMPHGLPVDKIAPAEWHGGLDMLIRPQAQKNNDCSLMGWKHDGQGWRVIGHMGDHDPYQATAHYNGTRGDMLIVGGHTTLSDFRKMTLIKADGTVERLPDIPAELGMGTHLGKDQPVLFHDPQTGNYLYKSNANFYELSPDLTEWRLAVNFLVIENKYMYPGNYWGWVCVPIVGKGVIGIFNYYRNQIYRHKSVF